MQTAPYAKERVTVTVTCAEGVFLYNGVRQDGTAAWPFYVRQEDGTLKGGAAPRRFRGSLSKHKKKERTSH